MALSPPPGGQTRGRSPRHRKLVLIIVGAVVAVVFVLDGIGAFTTEGDENAPTAQSATTSPSSSAPIPTLAPLTATTTAPPGGLTLFCGRKANTDSPFYVQLVDPTKAPGMCTAPDRTFSQEEFQEIPGLTRQCVFDRAEPIAQTTRVVSSS